MADNLMRTFISIPVPNEVKSKKNMLYSTLENSPANISWVKNEQLHLTLKFLGHTPETIFDNIKSEISKNVISSVQTLLKDINKLDGFNILHQSASNAGSLILGLQTENLQKVYDADVLYLLNADEVNIDKKNNQFIIYQGSHGGENSRIADVILPGAAYSEKNGSFVNLEGRVQRSYKASYPPGFAKEDFEIFNDIAKNKGSNHNYVSFDSLREEMINEHKLLGIYDEIQPSDIENLKIEKHIKKDHLIEINNIDYYQTNIVARSSKTMDECKSVKQQPRKTGTEN